MKSTAVRTASLLTASCTVLTVTGCDANDFTSPGHPARVLVLTETNGFRHSSIPDAVATVRSLGDSIGHWQVITVADQADDVRATVVADSLANFDLVVWANTTGDLSFSADGKRAFYDWMEKGGAFVGIHSASDTFHGDADYLRLLAGEFLQHGPQVSVTIHTEDTDHSATRALPAAFDFFDEIYEFQNLDSAGVHLLLALDNHPQTGAVGQFPLAWTNRLGDGRVFYTALGHREDVYDNPLFRAHLVGGIRWALGLDL